MDWLKLALWLEVIGFGISAIFVSIIKQEAVRNFVSNLYRFIREALTPVLWLLNVPIRKDKSIEEKKWGKAIIHLFIVSPILLILSVVIALPLYIVGWIALPFRRHKTLQIFSLVIGTAMVFIGLILELCNI